MPIPASTTTTNSQNHPRENGFSPRGQDVLDRVKSEYREMPGLCLTLPQAQRLWSLDKGTCTFVLTSLVAEGYLKASAAGYLRATRDR
jgi:hypothetical protein